MPVLHGSPEAVDEFFRPFIRGTQIVLGALGTALAVWLGPIWVWPVPAVVVLVTGQWLLARRPVHIYTMHLNDDRLILERGDEGLPFDIQCDEVISAQLMYQNQGPNRSMTWCVLVAPDQTLAFQMECEPIPEWVATDVPLDFMTALFGGNPGVLRALADIKDIVPQLLRDRDGVGLAWLRTHIPKTAWESPSIRVWSNESVAMDAHGLLDPAAAKRLHCHPEWISDATIAIDVSEKTLSASSLAIPHLNIHFVDENTIGFPTPTLDTWWPEPTVPIPPGRTTHLAEGALLFWWVLRTTQASQLPEPITAALQDVDRFNYAPSGFGSSSRIRTEPDSVTRSFTPHVENLIGIHGFQQRSVRYISDNDPFPRDPAGMCQPTQSERFVMSYFSKYIEECVTPVPLGNIGSP